MQKTISYYYRILLCIFCCWVSLAANAQGAREISGTVTDAEGGESIPGVNIVVKGTSTGTVTDIEGNYRLNLSEEYDTLLFSSVGYVSEELAVDNQTVINVALEQDVTSLEEVVVVGYGTIAKSDYTGSSSTVELDRVNENRAISVPEALQGKMAGVQIVTNTGEPGSGMSFNIRGLTSVTGSNQPLIVIDGQPIESGLGATLAGTGLDGGAQIPPADPLASLNPSDIASIEVLKDASSIAIYGSRGANGVVLITTKSGQAGEDKITYTTRFDLNMLPKQQDVLSSLEYMQFRNEAALNDGEELVYSEFQLDSISQAININWQDLIYRDALSQDHQISFSGGDAKSNYFITGNFADQNSIINNAGFKRGGLRVNYQRNISKKLTVGIRTYFSMADRRYGQQSNWTGILGSSAVMGALSFNPLRTPFNPDAVEDLDETFANNPLLVTTLVKDKTNIRTLTSNLTLDYKVTKDLQYQLRAGVNDIYSLRQLYYPTGTFIGNTAPDGSATRADNSNSNYVIDNILTYKKVFEEKHSINAVGGFSYQQWLNRSTSTTNTGFPSNALTYYNFASASFPGRTYTDERSRALASVLGRLNYTYDRRYSLTLTGRYDGATRLAEGHKWQLFPSVGLAWNISNERFFKENVGFMSLLKLRSSYGIAGNENIAIGATQAKYGINYVVLGADISPGYVVADFQNPNLTWETTRQLNLGADFGFVKDRVSLSVDLYEKITSDLLINLALPGSAGYGNYFTNIGEITNRGIDIESNFNILRGKIKLDAGANFSVFDNEVNNMGPLDIIYGRTYIAAGAIQLGQPLQVAKPGYPISSFWGYKTVGIYQDQAEIENDPAVSNDVGRSTIRPGDIKWVDTNGDGQITDADKTIIGNPSADFTYGLNANLSYKRLTFSMSVFGSYGNELINLNKWILAANNTNGNYNSLQEAYDNRWTGPGTSILYPRLTTERVRLNQRFPDWMVEDASFLRIQNVSIGYTFNLHGLNLGGLRTYVSGTNLLTLTKYSGYDPNINAFGHQALSSGTDFGTLPQPRTFSAGLELSF